MNKKYAYDLEERTAVFAEKVIEFARKFDKNTINLSLIDQLVRSGTSIGANYSEANQASSRKDFQNKIFICKKEANETKYWLRIIAKANPGKRAECREMWQESHELNLIFSKIISTSRRKV